MLGWFEWDGVRQPDGNSSVEVFSCAAVHTRKMRRGLAAPEDVASVHMGWYARLLRAGRQFPPSCVTPTPPHPQTAFLSLSLTAAEPSRD